MARKSRPLAPKPIAEPTVRELEARAVEDHRGRFEDRHRRSKEANWTEKAHRALIGCAEFAKPGAKLIGTDSKREPPEVLNERFGTSSDWLAVNEAYCKWWLRRWIKAVRIARTAGVTSLVESVNPNGAAEEITCRFFRQLLSAKAVESEAKLLRPKLAASRMALGNARFDLQTYFARVAEVVRAHREARLRASLLPSIVGTSDVSPSSKRSGRTRTDDSRPKGRVRADPALDSRVREQLKAGGLRQSSAEIADRLGSTTAEIARSRSRIRAANSRAKPKRSG